MRNMLFLLALLAAAMPATAAKRMTVDELKQAILLAQTMHRPDDVVLQQLAEVKLTARLTGAQLAQMVAACPGPKSVQAIHAIADQSSFLDPPADALPARPAPEQSVQKAIVARAIDYMLHAVASLPNFLATRVTEHYVDTLRGLEGQVSEARGGLFLMNTYSAPIAFRDGRESDDPALLASAEFADRKSRSKDAIGPPAQSAELGMSSWGDFGPILAVVLLDSAHGKLDWARWETEDGKPVAVFQFAVDRAASHYQVNYCCEASSSTVDYKNSSANDRRLSVVALKPAYHGRLEVDPDTGAVLRISVEADLRKEDPIQRASLMVEYARVQIGAGKFLCPTRSVSITYSRTEFESHGTLESTNRLQLNDVEFTGYHRFGSEATLIVDADPNSEKANHPETAEATSTEPTAPAPPAGAPAANPPATGTADSSAASAIAQSPKTPSTTLAQTAATPLPAGEPAPAPVRAGPVVPEMSVSAANGVPDEAASAAQTQQGDFQLKLTSRLVDVGIVVWDKKGHPVKDLKQADFEVYDNGHKQELRFFTQFSADASALAPVATPQRTFSNRVLDTATITAAPAESGATVLLIDESQVAWADLNYARQEMLRFISTLAPGERVGVYTMTGLGFRVIQEITTDHTALTAKLQKWMPSAQSVSQAQEEETRNRQSFDEVHNVADLNSVNGNQIDVPDAGTPIDPQLRTLGSNPARASLIILRQVARHLSAITGHKNLVWVSSDNVFADWLSNQVGIDRTPRQIDTFALHAEETMNDAHVAIYPMDVSQLETSAIGADIRTRNVELTPAAMDAASLNSGAQNGQNPVPVGRNQTNGRNTAEMQQDIHPIQGPIRMVADATGGRIIRRTGDLAGALNTVVEDGHATYVVGFYPQSPADDQYHNLTVKLTGQHKGVSLRYRTGYLYAKEPSTLKDRFQQAVWRPQDVSEVAVSAYTTPKSPGADIKLDILAADLGLQQRGGLWMDKLDIFMIQRDDAGIKAQVEGQTLGLRLRPATYQKLLSSGVPFQCTVQMHPGMASLRVLVVDENSRRMGSVTIPGPALQATP